MVELHELIEEVVRDLPHLHPTERFYEACRRLALEKEVEALEANW